MTASKPNGFLGGAVWRGPDYEACDGLAWERSTVARPETLAVGIQRALYALQDHAFVAPGD